ncbi:MAG: hypothetical protein QXK37_01465 [Candidatus Woesearchaeota archaeon]
MAVIGFNFNKIVAERGSAPKEKVSVSNNLSIKDVEEVSIAFGKEKQKALRFLFQFESKYSPQDVGNLSIDGEILYMQEPKKLKEIQEYWKKNNKLPNDVMPIVMNHILFKTNLKALNLASDVNLPLPLPMPRVRNAGSKA